jgi:hypothetical protein
MAERQAYQQVLMGGQLREIIMTVGATDTARQDTDPDVMS